MSGADLRESIQEELLDVTRIQEIGKVFELILGNADGVPLLVGGVHPLPLELPLVVSHSLGEELVDLGEPKRVVVVAAGGAHVVGLPSESLDWELSEVLASSLS